LRAFVEGLPRPRWIGVDLDRALWAAGSRQAPGLYEATSPQETPEAQETPSPHETPEAHETPSPHGAPDDPNAPDAHEMPVALRPGSEHG
jgi:hypothetical protein